MATKRKKSTVERMLGGEGGSGGSDPEPYRPGLPGQPVKADANQQKDRGYNWSDPTWKNPFPQVGSNEA